jgi:hypothetical protein
MVKYQSTGTYQLAVWTKTIITIMTMELRMRLKMELRIEVEKVEEVQSDMKEAEIKIRIISIFKVTNLSLFCCFLFSSNSFSLSSFYSYLTSFMLLDIVVLSSLFCINTLTSPFSFYNDLII